MNIPAEIANNAPAILEHSSQWVISHVEGQLGDFVWKQLIRAIGRAFPTLAEIDPRELATRVRRMEQAFAGLNEELARLRNVDVAIDVETELLEPATQDFVTDTFAAVMESPDDEKRHTLGRLVAQRLFTTTETADELCLRRAESLARRMNRAHLWTAATLYLVHYTPLPSGMSRADVYSWMDAVLLPILDKVCPSAPSYGDLDYLTSLGAVHYDRSDKSANLVSSRHAPAIEQRVLQETHEYPVPLSNNPRSLFYERASLLYEGKVSRENGIELISLAPYALTTPGFRLGQTVTNQLLDEAAAARISLRGA